MCRSARFALPRGRPVLVSAEFFRRDDAEEALPYVGTVSSVCRKSLSCMMKEALSHRRKARSAWLHGGRRGDVWLYQARCQSVISSY